MDSLYVFYVSKTKWIPILIKNLVSGKLLNPQWDDTKYMNKVLKKNAQNVSWGPGSVLIHEPGFSSILLSTPTPKRHIAST